MRHQAQPQPANGADETTRSDIPLLKGAVKGDFAICEGTATDFPSLTFKAVLTRVAD